MASARLHECPFFFTFSMILAYMWKWTRLFATKGRHRIIIEIKYITLYRIYMKYITYVRNKLLMCVRRNTCEHIVYFGQHSINIGVIDNHLARHDAPLMHNSSALYCSDAVWHMGALKWGTRKSGTENSGLENEGPGKCGPGIQIMSFTSMQA